MTPAARRGSFGTSALGSMDEPAATTHLTGAQRRLLSAQLLQAAQLLPAGAAAVPAVIAALRCVAGAAWRACCQLGRTPP